MKGTSLVGLGATVFLVTGFLYACGGKSASPSSPTPTPTPTPTNGTFIIKGSTSVGGLFAGPVMLPGTPTSVRVRMYKVYLSTKADCSSPVLVQDKGMADYQDLVGRPTIFSGSVAAGTYQCLIVKVNDIMKFTPDAAAQAASGGVCVAGREADFDILKAEDPAEYWYDVDTGSALAGAGWYGQPVPQDVYLFVSTDKAAVTAANSRVHPHQLVTLTSPIVIAASQVTNGAFVFDAGNRMAVTSDGRGGSWCWLETIAAQYVGQ